MKTFSLAIMALLGYTNAIALKDSDDYASIKAMVAQVENYSEF